MSADKSEVVPKAFQDLRNESARIHQILDRAGVTHAGTLENRINVLVSDNRELFKQADEDQREKARLREQLSNAESVTRLDREVYEWLKATARTIEVDSTRDPIVLALDIGKWIESASRYASGDEPSLITERDIQRLRSEKITAEGNLAVAKSGITQLEDRLETKSGKIVRLQDELRNVRKELQDRELHHFETEEENARLKEQAERQSEMLQSQGRAIESQDESYLLVVEGLRLRDELINAMSEERHAATLTDEAWNAVEEHDKLLRQSQQIPEEGTDVD